MEVKARFTISPIYMESGSAKLGKWNLRRFQEKVMDTISSKKNTVLTAPTGAGKTLTLLLGKQGMVGLYPNNTLLLDQQKSIDKILRSALNARLVSREKSDPNRQDSPDLLRIYELDDKYRLPNSKNRRVVVVLLSGQYIPYEKDESGRFISKREIIKEKIVDKICYPKHLGEEPYIIVMGTPDTALMILSGIYRDFEKVGYTLHDAIIASSEGIDLEYILSRFGVATVSELKSIASIRDCLLRYPWFIDEFHLYGLYEALMVLPLIHVYRDYIGWEEPVILSSATPKGVLYKRLIKKLNPIPINAVVSTKGSPDSLVRGVTEVEIVEVEVSGRGILKWFKVGYNLDSIIANEINKIKQVLSSNGNAFIIVDRVNQVTPIVGLLYHNYGIKPECSVAIKPTECVDSSNIVVGSESISQGINRDNVKYGIVTSYNWASLIQRFGRIGRRTDSRVVLVLPKKERLYPMEELDERNVTYSEFIDKVKSTYPDIDLSRKPETSTISEIYGTRSELIEYASVITYAKVSSAGNMLRTLQDILATNSHILDKFYGKPATIPSILTFRSSGPPVLVKKPDGKYDATDLGTVIRNYAIMEVETEIKDVKGVTDRWLVLKIDLIPDRYKVVLHPPLNQPEDLLGYFNGTITTLGTLIELGYRMEIISWDDPRKRLTIPDPPRSILEQAIAIVRTTSELVKYYTYVGEGAEVYPQKSGTLALFL